LSEAPTGSAPRRRRAPTVAFLTLAGLFAAGGVLLQLGAPDAESIPPASAQALALRTLIMREETALPRAELTGLLEARRSVELFAEVPGRVLEVGAEELDRVEAGQLLLRMDPLLAEVAIDRAKAAIARAESQGTYARANLDRNQGLAGRNVASRAALDQAENESRLAAAAKLDALAALAEAEDSRKKKLITAPFAGVLRSFPVEQGEYIQAGERVAELLDVARLRVKLGLTDRQIVSVSQGVVVDVVVAARPSDRFSGRIVQVGGAIDLETHKFPIEIEVPNEAGRLLPGMVARIGLSLGEAHAQLALPLDAIVDEFGLKHVYAVEGDGDGWVVRKRRIALREIPFDPTRFEVVEGLADGDRVAVSSVRQLRDGMAVRLIAEPDPPHLGRSVEVP